MAIKDYSDIHRNDGPYRHLALRFRLEKESPAEKPSPHKKPVVTCMA